MAEAILNIKHWGNSLGVRLPVAVAREAHLREDQQVRLTVEEGRVIISPIHDNPLTLKQRLELYKPERHDREVMQGTEKLGAEKW